MRARRWRPWAELVAAVSVVVSLAVLIFEVRANTLAVERQVLLDRTASVTEPFTSAAELRITVHRDLAHAWAEYEARFGDPGDVSEWSGIDAFTLLRHDGKWKIASLAYVADGS